MIQWAKEIFNLFELIQFVINFVIMGIIFKALRQLTDKLINFLRNLYYYGDEHAEVQNHDTLRYLYIKVDCNDFDRLDIRWLKFEIINLKNDNRFRLVLKELNNLEIPFNDLPIILNINPPRICSIVIMIKILSKLIKLYLFKFIFKNRLEEIQSVIWPKYFNYLLQSELDDNIDMIRRINAYYCAHQNNNYAN